MKNNRQEKILAIIEAEPIETQEQLLSKLQEQGIESTQATISRDIKQLHLIKEPVGGGRYRYAVSAQKIKLNFAGRLQVILRESILSADRAQNLVVVKMMPASAPRRLRLRRHGDPRHRRHGQRRRHGARRAARRAERGGILHRADRHDQVRRGEGRNASASPH